MNLNDKNIDQIFRDAAQNSSAPRYDHSYWNEMNSILNDQNKRKRRVILWSVSGTFITVLLVSALFILNNKPTESQFVKNTSLSTDNENVAVQNSVKDISIAEKTSTADYKKKKVDLKKIKTSESKIDQRISSGASNDLLKNHLVEKTKSQKSLKNYSSEKRVDVLNKIDEASVQMNSMDDQNTTMKNSLTEIDGTENEKTSNVDLSPRIVSMQNLKAEKELVPFTLLNESPFNYYAKLSAGLMENYETSRPFQSGVFDLSLNIEYQKEHVLFRTGIGFQATSNADLVVSERAKVYGFGITTHQNNLSYQSLYDIYVPIELGYTLNNTSFGFGAQVSYLLRTTMNYESLENKVIVEEYRIKGFSEGLNTLTAQGYVWLEQKLTDRFAAGVKVGTNLNSRIKEGKYFNESATTNPLYGQLTLRYNINK